MLIKPPEPKGKLDTVTVNGPEDALDWDAIDWRAHEGNVRGLRRRTFKATREQDWAQVRSLQKMMLRSWTVVLEATRSDPQVKAPAPGLSAGSHPTVKRRHRQPAPSSRRPGRPRSHISRHAAATPARDHPDRPGIFPHRDHPPG